MRVHLAERLLLRAVSYMVRVRVRIRFSVWLVSGYAHVSIGLLLSVVIVTLPRND